MIAEPEISRPPLPPFSRETALNKVRAPVTAQNRSGWSSRRPLSSNPA
jgi:nuclear transport factor 2 (NTF2) superfamily protein